MMPRIYNVHYTRTDRITYNKDKAELNKSRHQVILIDKHPLEWAMQPNEEYAKIFIDTIDWWQRVEEDEVVHVLKAVENNTTLVVEDYRTKEG